VKLKTGSAVIAALAVTAAAIVLWSRASGPEGAALAGRQGAMESLGESIAKLRPKSKVLVLSNPFAKDSGLLDKKAQFERAGLRGLRKGLGPDSSVTVVFPEMMSRESALIPPESRTPLSFLIRPGAVEKLADAHPECSVIVSLIGVPAGVDQGKLWKEDDRRCFAFLSPDLRVIGSAQNAADAYDRGKILVTVTDDALQPGKPLIVTRNNVREVLERQPHSLGY
jgi:hypothetical protein